MKYDFDQVLDRTHNDSSKYDERLKKFGTMDVLPLWVADMDFKAAQPILNAMEDKVRQGVFGYVSRREEYFDSDPLAEAAQRLGHPGQVPFELFRGGGPSLAALVRQFAKPGEKVLIQPPVYPEFYEVVENSGCEVLSNRLVEREGEFFLDLADFEAKLKEGPKCFLFCNPQNPTGHVWTRG